MSKNEDKKIIGQQSWKDVIWANLLVDASISSELRDKEITNLIRFLETELEILNAKHREEIRLATKIGREEAQREIIEYTDLHDSRCSDELIGIRLRNLFNAAELQPAGEKLESETKTIDTSKVTRVEVIGKSGRLYVNWDERNQVQLSLQDEGRTLKIFMTERP